MKIARKFMLYVGGIATLITLLSLFFISFSLNSILYELEEQKANEKNQNLYQIVEKQINGMTLATGFMAAFGLLIFFIQLIYISRRIVAPLNKAVDFSNNLAKGDFNAKLPKGAYTDEIGELIKSLNFMRDRLQNSIIKLQKSHMRETIARKDAESANNLKSDFLANMSLELRNPLNSIIGFSSLIMKDIGKGRYDDSLQQKVSTIHESAEALNGLISNLLELSKLDSSETSISISKFETAALMRELINTNIAAAEDKNISIENHFSSDAPQNIICDRDILFQILNVLISTMINYSNIGNSVSFGCKSSGTKIVFWLRTYSSWQSIPLSSIYNKYVNEKTEQLPVGIGAVLLNLTIAKTNTTLLGAELKTETEKDSHSLFTITFNKDDLLPQEEEETSTIHTATNIKDRLTSNKEFKTETSKFRVIAPAPKRSLSILLTEDNEASRMLIELTLKGLNCTLECAEDGIVCMEKLSKKKFDLLLLDLQMPNMDGFTVIEKLRKDRNFDNMPIIVISAYLENSDKNKLIQAGATDCIIKPINIDELLNTIKRLAAS
ncbi:MAG: hypothetical protein A2017_10240 [Lentisphaerae bacterium GWF2_44_16]|nr:MAG: hypothetical protein A2017_10240 [Lentisphaerae bacterium GWF2_44_16]